MHDSVRVDFTIRSEHRNFNLQADACLYASATGIVLSYNLGTLAVCIVCHDYLYPCSGVFSTLCIFDGSLSVSRRRD